MHRKLKIENAPLLLVLWLVLFCFIIMIMIILWANTAMEMRVQLQFIKYFKWALEIPNENPLSLEYAESNE